jgi:uncharacterized protein
MKFLLWLAIAVLFVMWLTRGKKAPPAPRPASPEDEAESMLQCAQCGVHLPASEALRDADGRAFCSEAHRLQHGDR